MKESFNIVIVGHVDHGKSTLIGRLLYDTRSLPKEKIVEVRKISKELGKEMELAFLMDHLKEEREKNITIDTTQIFFKSRKRNYVIIDAPGHVEFTKNMLTGASRADGSLLIIDAHAGIQEQTRRHAYLLKMLGIKDLIVVLNKMDLVRYKEHVFNTLKEEILTFLKTLNLYPSFIIPLSSKEGIHISKYSSLMPWYQGHYLINALDQLKMNEKTKKPLRLPIQDIYECDGTKIIVGKITSGTLKQGQKVTLLPTREQVQVASIMAFGKSKKKNAQKNENIGLIITPSLPIKRGDVLSDSHQSAKIKNIFGAHLFWISEKPLKINEPFTLRCNTQSVHCEVLKIEKRINSSTLQVLEIDASLLNTNEAAVVVLEAKVPLIHDPFNFIEEMGRFVIEQDFNIQGAGVIKEDTLF
ncbi:MAG: GTP-binding protein [Deltaproteobacteria bacterium]|nr:GTP-binding protein [Deltaproteobacteria bacterium]